jgi:hypothetical protein
VVLKLLTERICQAGKAANAHSDAEILALNVGRADAFRIGQSDAWDNLRGNHIGRRIAVFAFRAGAIDLNQLGEIHAIRQCVTDRGAVRGKAVGRDLKLASGSEPKTLNEYIRAGPISTTHNEVEHELGVRFKSDERVAVTQSRIIIEPTLLFLLPDETLQLIGLNVAHGNVHELPAKDVLALLAGDHQELQNRGVVNIGKPFHARNAVAFQEEPQDHLGFLNGQIHAVQVVLTRLRENLAALGASAVTSKPANGGHPKTGQWKTQFGQHLLYPAQPRSGKEFQGKKSLWRAPKGREPRSSWWGKKPSPPLWECGNRAVGDFQARWETTENRRLVFRVFHGAAFP